MYSFIRSEKERFVLGVVSSNTIFISVKHEQRGFTPTKASTASEFRHQREVETLLAAGLVRTSATPAFFDDFYIREAFKLLNPKFMVLKHHTWRTRILQLAAECAATVIEMSRMTPPSSTCCAFISGGAPEAVK